MGAKMCYRKKNALSLISKTVRHTREGGIYTLYCLYRTYCACVTGITSKFSDQTGKLHTYRPTHSPSLRTMMNLKRHFHSCSVYFSRQFH